MATDVLKSCLGVVVVVLLASKEQQYCYFENQFSLQVACFRQKASQYNSPEGDKGYCRAFIVNLTLYRVNWERSLGKGLLGQSGLWRPCLWVIILIALTEMVRPGSTIPQAGGLRLCESREIQLTAGVDALCFALDSRCAQLLQVPAALTSPQ